MARTIRVISSPSKSMAAAPAAAPWTPTVQPQFADAAQVLVDHLRKLPFEELEALWRGSYKLDEKFYQELEAIDPHRGTSPAILAFTGTEYRAMDPQSMSAAEAAWMNDHFRMLSGLFGLLRPCDAIAPYRLEFNTELRMPCRVAADGTMVDEPAKTLFKFWGEALVPALEQDAPNGIHVVNLASEEYAHAIVPFLKDGTPMTTCVFLEPYSLDHTEVQRGTNSKEARGAMTRWMAQNAIEDPADLRGFGLNGYRFDPDRSDANVLAFSRDHFETQLPYPPK